MDKKLEQYVVAALSLARADTTTLLTLQNRSLTAALGLRIGDAETATGKRKASVVEERILNHNEDRMDIEEAVATGVE